MSEILKKSLLENKVHFGHMSKKWNPKMSKYIFMKKDDIHILDLNKTINCLNAAADYMKSLAKAGRKILFVGTKDQARDVMESAAEELKMPYASERWLGGTLTNFGVIKKMIKTWQTLEKNSSSNSYQYLTKKEKLMQERRKAKSASLLIGLKDITRLPAAVFVVDIIREKNAVLEARALKIPVIAIVDTNANPDMVDVPIPANDDSVSSIQVIVNYLKKAINEGLEERMKEVEAKKAITMTEKTTPEDEEKKINVKEIKKISQAPKSSIYQKKEGTSATSKKEMVKSTAIISDNLKEKSTKPINEEVSGTNESGENKAVKKEKAPLVEKVNIEKVIVEKKKEFKPKTTSAKKVETKKFETSEKK